MYWEGNDTSCLQISNTKQPVLEQFSINDTTDIRLCHRCGGEGHIRKYCNVNVQCDFCKSYSHHTSVCRSYANFVQAHPMASSRRTSPVQFNKQVGWPHPLVEEDPRTTALHNNDGTCSKYEVGRRREISDITRKHLEQVVSAMIPSSTGSSIDPVESAPVNSMVTQQSCREPEEMSFKRTAKENEKHTIINNYYVSNKESGWKQLQKGEILPNMSGNYTQKAFSEISTDKSQNETQMDQKLNVSQDVRTGPKTTIEEAKQYYSEKGEVQNMSPPPTLNLNYPPLTRREGNSETSTMLDCIRQLQLMLEQHILTNSKQAEYHMSQNADLFTEMIKVQKRRDLDPTVMAIPAFTGQEPEKCLDWINRIKNICSQAGCSLHQELMNKSEPVVQNFIRTMGDTWTDEGVIEEILKIFLGYTNACACYHEVESVNTRRGGTNSNIQPKVQNIGQTGRRKASREDWLICGTTAVSGKCDLGHKKVHKK